MATESLQSNKVTKFELKTTWARGIVYCKVLLIFGSETQEIGTCFWKKKCFVYFF